MKGPNSNQLSQAFGAVSEERPKFRNIPAFNQEADALNLASVIERLDGIQNQQAQMQTQMDQMQT
ncbi:hypothetical protein sscle_02g018380 [Sclerotinia sclerotiorum 1980 UF-70]|uniref:Uncharacterized protein n=1 Tax=Sclerotinia sclerotiorum (strain ATCC 18683 / 1980 / Ss-1) TaxID=665079 RepID=A0A1D9PWI2_SCLS1|nr:hypothetical protein sscle_02g018380 [Sclerotinia sclerotiorum 1980 UF-70]